MQEGHDVARIKISLHLWLGNGKRIGGGKGVGWRVGYGVAYLRVIPEGRTPSAWDPADNVPPFCAPHPLAARRVTEPLYWVSKSSNRLRAFALRDARTKEGKQRV